jgi:glucokinase
MFFDKNSERPLKRKEMFIGGIDIGGTKIAAGVVSSEGSVVDFREFPTADMRDPGKAVDQIGEYFNCIQRRTQEPLYGIGIGCTGPVDPIIGRIGSVEFLEGWEGFDIVSEFKEKVETIVYLENDADASAIGEMLFGVGRDSDHFINVTVGTGIGVGVILNKQLFRGVDGTHPEIGHHIINISGPHCSCGAQGCWESMAGGKATLLATKNKYGMEYGSTAELYEAALNNDKNALAAVRDEALYLGIGISNIITIFAPDTISISGGILRCQDLIWDPILQSMQQNCGLIDIQKIKIVPSALGKHTGLIGAASICLFLKTDHE